MMPESGLVSVIMPTYNQCEFIAQAISSVLGQTYKGIELIIIDNYSQDNTHGIAHSFNDPRIRYFRFKNNGIIAASRNFGITKAAGEFIAFIDSDDIWFEAKIEDQLKLFHRDKSVCLVFSPFRINSTEKSFKDRVIGPYGKELRGYLHENLLRYNFITLSSAIVRASVLNEVDIFDESPDIMHVEDFDLWLRIARRYKIASSGKIMGTYRMHMNNQSLGCNRLRRAFNVLGKHYEKGWISKDSAKKAKAHLLCREGWNFTGAGDSSLSRRLFYEAFRENSHADIRLTAISCLGMILSLSPELCLFLKRKGIDKRFKNIGHLATNYNITPYL